MRPPRLILILCCFVALPIFLTFFSLLYSHPRHRAATESEATAQTGGVRAFFSFHTPASLFPLSAIISLTDDNSTFFLARPASFGPLLPSAGLSGQLWVGSGFGDDSLRRGGAVTGAEGELGCSDVPGWSDGNKQHRGDNSGETSSSPRTPPQLDNQAAASQNIGGKQLGSEDEDTLLELQNHAVELVPHGNDGTDDHLHHPLPESQLTKAGRPGQPLQHDTTKDNYLPEHADIQSLQEGAEIAGKVVLLSRGGCGFLEKAKWVQRRGGMALIVGDDTRGNPLITMYGRGDTSNITIPALFTSHTTAHLLSSLIPPKRMLDDTSVDDGSRTASGDSRLGRVKKRPGKKNKSANGGPTFTPTLGSTKPTGLPRPSIVPLSKKRLSSAGLDVSGQSRQKRSWLRSLASAFGLGGQSGFKGLPADSRRPPSSGRINWIISETWTDELPSSKKNQDVPNKANKVDTNSKSTSKLGSLPNSAEDFVIGVQDWRDPDLVVGKSSPVKGKIKTETSAVKGSTPTASPADNTGVISDQNGSKLLKGGSITPGSGEYGKPGHMDMVSAQSSQSVKDQAPPSIDSGYANSESTSWLDGLRRESDAESISTEGDRKSQSSPRKLASYEMEEFYLEEGDEESDFFDGRDGLWVTLEPTTISTSPFVDTLLVLVVSPLVTLTVVYALLLLRSRIRRRRWRAPKSVVDRLPVRTYHTMSCTSSSSSSQLASPATSSPTSPLLRTSPQSIIPRPRPRSRTTAGISDTVSDSLNKATAKASLSRNTPEKKKYTGKQVECVVCLEEYIDGQSRVMSLPCGHEFHAECITPWLTTRRRTCPICKGDVVRSMARASIPPSPTMLAQASYRDDPDEDDIQTQVALTANDSPSSAIPIPRGLEETDADLERGDDMAATLVNDHPDDPSFRTGWRGLASLSLSAFSGEAAWRQAQADRNR